MTDIVREVELFDRLEPVRTVLKVLSQTSGLRVALVARVTGGSWTACAVHDEAGYGLRPGDKLDLTTTY